MAKSTFIEVQIGGKWKKLSVNDALSQNERYGRCVECHNPARCHGRGKNGMSAHVEHLSWNKKCSLCARRSASAYL
jgi:hypothetical protein